MILSTRRKYIDICEKMYLNKTKDGWTRARVFKKDEAKITLLLGDIGELAEANSEDLHHLPDRFQNEDFFSFWMKIPDGDWSREVETKIQLL